MPALYDHYTHTTRFCYDRLSSLMKTLEITNTDEFMAIQLVADFGTLLGTYSRGFAIIIEPYDERLPHIPDPVLQLRWVSTRGKACLEGRVGSVTCGVMCCVVATLFSHTAPGPGSCPCLQPTPTSFEIAIP